MEPIFSLESVIIIGTVIVGFFVQHISLVKDITSLNEKHKNVTEKITEVKKDIDTLFQLQRESETTCSHAK